MQVTEIRVNNIDPKESGICGEFTIVLDDMLCIHKIHVINGSRGLFIAFPNTGEMRLYKNSKRFFDLVHPINKTLRETIESEVLKVYYSEVEKL